MVHIFIINQETTLKLTSINPSDNTIIGEVEVTTEVEITSLVDKAQKAKDNWNYLGIEGRNKILRKFYDTIESHKEELAQLQAKEMGMPLTETEEDIMGGLSYLRWYFDNAAECLKSEVSFEDDNEVHTVYREPRGVVGAIIPWNFPMSNFVWQCGQNLVAGNVVILKHSEEVPLFSKKLESIAKESGIPEGVLGFAYGDGKVGDMLAHQNIDLLCFTGSTKVGKYLYTVAAEKFIPALLEMGGSAPGIIFEDADVPAIIDAVMMNRFIDCGQVCDGLKRLIVHKSKYDEAIKLLTEKISAKKIGIANDKETEIGPLVAERQVKVIELQVEDARTKGATIVVGGKRPSNLSGAFYEPTLITGVTKDMKVWNEETFGPVLPVITFETEEEAIELANDTSYGLGAYVFTVNKEKMERVARRIEAGMISQNNITYLKPSNPFGGYKQSGIGREHGKYGFHDVTQVKVVASEKQQTNTRLII